MKYFIVADVHGFFNELMTALDKAGYDKNNKDHVFVSLGDLLDRGRQAKECLDFVNSIPEENKILISGNHEDLIQEVINRTYFEQWDLSNGTIDTFCQIAGYQLLPDDENIDKVKNYQPLQQYFSSLVEYKEVGDNIFVHGWIPCYDRYNNPGHYYKEWRGVQPFVWKQCKWLNGMDMWERGVVEPGKTIWCGHWHTSWGHANINEDGVEFLDRIETFYIDSKTGKKEPHANYEPFVANGIVAMDSCVVVSGFINCKVLEV